MKRIFATQLILVPLLLLAGCLSTTPLREAVKRGDVLAVNMLLAKGADVCETGDYGLTAFSSALSSGHTSCKDEIYRTLIDKAYENVNKGGSCPTILFDAAFGGCTDIVERLLASGKDYGVNRASGMFYKHTPLAMAAYGGHTLTVNALLNKGADLEMGIDDLKKLASLNAKYLSNAPNREVYNNANEGVALLNQLKFRQETSSRPVVAKALAEIPSSPVIRSDVDEFPARAAKPNKNAYAVVIGIETYRQKLPRADFAAQDASLVADYLTKIMGYSEENVVTLTNDHATLGDLVKYIEKWLPNNVESGSSVFVYYSGHGAPNPKTSDAYLVPYDGDPSFIDETGYSLKRMYAALGKLPAKEIIVALDSCFSGAGGRSVIAKGSRPLVMNLQNSVVLSKNMTVLSASSGEQTSSTYDEKGHGLFTYFLLKGIKNEDVTRADGSLKMDDLFGYIKPQVERIARKQYNNEQTPQLMGPK